MARRSRVSRSLRPGERLGIALFDRVCWICKEDRPGWAMEIDHPFSRHHGGPTSFENSRLAHVRCNRSKGPKTYLQQVA